MAWRRPTGRASATSSGRWSSGWKSHVTRSMSCFGSTHIRVITILKKKVCNFVGGEPKLPRDSVINVSQLLTVDKSLLTERLVALPTGTLRKVADGLRLVLNL